MRRATHPVMRALRPPAAAGQSLRASSSPRLASVKDTDDDDNDVDNGGGGLWQRGWQDPAAVVAIVVVDDDGDGNKRIVEAEQRGRTTKDVVSPTPSSPARFVIHRFHHRAIVNTFAAGRRPLSPIFASHCPIHHLRRSR